jgi:hypothetical protein
MENKQFKQEELEAISAALGDSDEGLTGSEISHILSVCRFTDPSPKLSKRFRIHNALVADQNQRGSRTGVLAFMRNAMKPERYEPLRANLNRALAFVGLAFDAAGHLESIDTAATLSEANRRADELRADLTRRGAEGLCQPSAEDFRHVS